MECSFPEILSAAIFMVPEGWQKRYDENINLNFHIYLSLTVQSNQLH